MNRRQLLAGAALAGWSLSATAVRLTDALATSPNCIVVHDGRYSDARLFAAALVANGATAIDTHAHPDSWIVALLARCRPADTLLCGMTTSSDLALLRGCAADPRLRLLHDALHDCRGAQSITHTLQGPHAASLAAGLRRQRTGWPGWLAQQLANVDHRLGSATQGSAHAAHPPAPDHPGSLRSWVFG